MHEKQVDIIIADTQYLIVQGILSIVTFPFEIKKIVECKVDLLESLQNEKYNVLIIDYAAFDFDGYNDLKEIKKMYPELGIIILTNNMSRIELNEFNNIGIRNILYKSADKEEFFSCLNCALKGKKYFSDSILDMMLDKEEKKNATGEIVNLTNTEIIIVRMIAQGLTTKEIACQRFLSFHTVMTHRKNILRKVGVSNASELIMYAIRTGIIDTVEYHI